MSEAKSSKKFTKIKFDGEKVHLAWTETAGPDGVDEVKCELSSNDLPHESFTAALLALKSTVTSLCDLPITWLENDLYPLVVRSASINYEDGGLRGFVVTSLKYLPRTNAPMVLNTPHMREDDGESQGNCAPSDMVGLIEDLEREAVRYIKGHRAQGDLFNDDEQLPKAAE